MQSGGISFFASKYGWGCDNVVNFEIVTASGDILNVNYESYPDLYWALRGGGSNFGIVTRFDLETFPQGDVFAGDIIFPYVQSEAVISAFAKFADTPDSKAATWIVIASNEGHKMLSVLTMYGEPEPKPEVFEELRSIPSIVDLAKVRTLTDMTLQVGGSSPKGDRQMYWTHTFRFERDFIAWFAEMFFEELEPIAGKYEGHKPFPVIQIITRESVARMSRNGGNCLPLKEEDAPFMNIIFSCSWKNDGDDEPVIGLIARVMGKAAEEGKKRGLFIEYVYMNYASEYQDVLKSYGEENYGKLRAIAEKYDPSAVFQKLMPGYFKFGGAPRTEGPRIGK